MGNGRRKSEGIEDALLEEILLLDEADEQRELPENIEDAYEDLVRRLTRELLDGGSQSDLGLDETGDRILEGYDKTSEAKRSIRKAISDAEAEGADPETIDALKKALDHLEEAQRAIESAQERNARDKALQAKWTDLERAREDLERALKRRGAARNARDRAEAEEALDEATTEYKARLREWLLLLGLSPKEVDAWLQSFNPKTGGLIRPWLPKALPPPSDDRPTVGPDNRTEEERLRALAKSLIQLLRLLAARSPYSGPGRRNEEYLEKMVREYNERAQRLNRERNHEAERFRPLPTVPSPKEFFERLRRERRNRRRR